MSMTADLSDESFILFQTVRDVTVVLFSRLLSTDVLQHNCSTQGEKDFKVLALTSCVLLLLS